MTASCFQAAPCSPAPSSQGDASFDSAAFSGDAGRFGSVLPSLGRCAWFDSATFSATHVPRRVLGPRTVPAAPPSRHARSTAPPPLQGALASCSSAPPSRATPGSTAPPFRRRLVRQRRLLGRRLVRQCRLSGHASFRQRRPSQRTYFSIRPGSGQGVPISASQPSSGLSNSMGPRSRVRRISTPCPASAPSAWRALDSKRVPDFIQAHFDEAPRLDNVVVTPPKKLRTSERGRRRSTCSRAGAR